ncbi:hypothetical protein AC1031_003087 [Aphanomyces cochlioides]|nr:hypothetical protein AC1031_003087 [Aphanomyces cochlioides]
MPQIACLPWHKPAPMSSLWRTFALCSPQATRPKRKQVTFTTATTYIFPLEYGGSAIPSDHGPPIGLANAHTRQECHHLDNVVPKRGRVRKFDHVERMVLLQQNASYSRKEVARFCFEAIAIRQSRVDTQYDDEEEDNDDEEPQHVVKRRKIEHSCKSNP